MLLILCNNWHNAFMSFLLTLCRQCLSPMQITDDGCWLLDFLRVKEHMKKVLGLCSNIILNAYDGTFSFQHSELVNYQKVLQETVADDSPGRLIKVNQVIKT